MTYQQFYDTIVEPSGYDAPCSIRPPGIGKVHAQLLNGDAYEKLCRRVWKANSNVLWGKLHALVSPTAVLDSTIAVGQCKRVTYESSGQMIIVPLKEFHASFMRCCRLLYENPRPVICYAAFFIGNLAPALHQKVEAKFQDHIGHQTMTNEVKFEMMNQAYAIALQCERDIAVTADIVWQMAISSMTAFVQQHTVGAASIASALTSLASPTSGLAVKLVIPGAVAAVSQAEQFLEERHCHSCNRPMGKNTAKGEYRGMYWSKCPNAGDKAAMERDKVQEANFKAWKERHGPKRDKKKKKKSFKSRVKKKIWQPPIKGKQARGQPSRRRP